MTELVCVACAIKDDAVDATFVYDEKNPLAERSCPKCKSSATVATDVFKRFAQARADADKRKLRPQAPAGAANRVGSKAPPAVQQAVETSKILNEKMKWSEHVAALRAFLLRGNSQLVQANGWWDGYHFYMEHSWAVDQQPHALDSLDYVTIKLINKGGAFKEVLLYINPDDEGYAEVSTEQS